MRSPRQFVDLLPNRRVLDVDFGQRIPDRLLDRFQLDDYPFNAARMIG